MDEYKININVPEEDIPRLTKECFNWLRWKFGVNTKITDLPELLRASLDMELEGINYNSDWTPQFVSYLIDLQRDFMAGRDIDMVVFHQDIIKVFHLSRLERQLLVDKNPEERLWSIWLAVSCKNRKNFNLKND